MRMKRPTALFLSAVIATISSGRAFGQDPNIERLRANAAEYASRFKLRDPDSRAVDDRGKGPSDLQGLRNFRVVIPGILYRAGGNNAYRVPPLPNTSPLPPEALVNLCKQGFTQAVYLYRKGYVPQNVPCESQGQPHQIAYTQLSIDGKKPAPQERQLLQFIRDQISSGNPHPILVHCYNGYHESGYASAIALRQFCGFSSDQAYNYWARNAAKGVSFSAMKDRIDRFTPIPELAISPAQSKAICFEAK